METEVNCHSEPLGEEPSFRAVGEESHTSLVRDISLSLNMTKKCVITSLHLITTQKLLFTYPTITFKSSTG